MVFWTWNLKICIAESRSAVENLLWNSLCGYFLVRNLWNWQKFCSETSFLFSLAEKRISNEPFHFSDPSWKSKGHKVSSPLQTWKEKFCLPHTVLRAWLTERQEQCIGHICWERATTWAEAQGSTVCGPLKAEGHQDDSTSTPITMPWHSPFPSLSIWAFSLLFLIFGDLCFSQKYFSSVKCHRYLTS